MASETRSGEPLTQAAVLPPGQPSIKDYALIGDCHSAALVSRDGSIDWCCIPRINSPSCFARLLDAEGGYCSIRCIQPHTIRRDYVGPTMVLCTSVETESGEARIFDCFTMREGGRHSPHHQLLRIIEGVRGETQFELKITPRFDYGEVRPWMRRHADNVYAAIGGSHGLLISCDTDLHCHELHDLEAPLQVAAGQRIRLSIQFFRPELLDDGRMEPITADDIDRRLDETLEWWRTWSSQGQLTGPEAGAVLRSAIVLKALIYAPTGAMAAAPTTSLPEVDGGVRNWDYRYSWIRDSVMAVTSLGQIGFHHEADGFRRFMQRSAGGSAADLQVLYGLGGERHMPEVELSRLAGYRGARPVRIGNAASTQLQLDAYGNLAELVWRWQRRGHSPDDDAWRFLVDIVDTAAARWEEPDKGIWEVRGRARHFVHSKVMCWLALDRGIRLAEECMRRAPTARWAMVAARIRAAVEEHGYDHERGVFVQAFDSPEMDAALLLIPDTGFVEHGDPRMVRTVDAIRQELGTGGLVLRYRSAPEIDGLPEREGTFLACSFWLARCLVLQGRHDEAREVFGHAVSTSNDVGLFAEEFDSESGEMLGNFPQALTHMAYIDAAMTLSAAH
ncbi:MAG: glycoside hydrolase family 15 protein [Candidatus Dormibacterales bacterium]